MVLGQDVTGNADIIAIFENGPQLGQEDHDGVLLRGLAVLSHLSDGLGVHAKDVGGVERDLIVVLDVVKGGGGHVGQRNQIWVLGADDGAEPDAVPPGARQVGHLDIGSVFTLALILKPLLGPTQ